VKRSGVTYSASPAAPEGTSSISSGLSIVSKIVGEGTLEIFAHVKGEVHASTVQIGDGAQVEGDIVAEELTIGGRVTGRTRVVATCQISLLRNLNSRARISDVTETYNS
jgi:cytoskeletal protein CcmA (bactofilin family)